MITISKTHFIDIKAHGEDAYPDECCGALLGGLDQEGTQKTATGLVRLENQTTENKHRRFAITAEDYRALESRAKEKGLTLLGFYHTHPDHPAEPSKTDLKFAWPFFSYLILSVEKGKSATLRSFELNIQTQSFHKEDLKIGN